MKKENIALSIYRLIKPALKRKIETSHNQIPHFEIIFKWYRNN